VPPRTRLEPYLRLGTGDLLAQLLSFLARLVAVQEYTLSGQFYALVVSDGIIVSCVLAVITHPFICRVFTTLENLEISGNLLILENSEKTQGI